MKYVFLLFSLQFILGNVTIAFSQTEEFTYCLTSTDSIFIEKIDEVVGVDTVLKTFSEDWTNTEYTIMHLNDTLYSLYNGTYYFLGTNQAIIGDQWHPLRYNFMSFQDSSTNCANLMNLEVTDVSQILFDGNLINVIQLLDLDLEFNVEYEFIEGIGISKGGPLYNLTQQHSCDIWLDFPFPQFKLYTNDLDSIDNSNLACYTLGADMIDANSAINVFIEEDNLTVFSSNAQIRNLALINLSGQCLKESNGNKISFKKTLNSTFYLLKIEFEDGNVIYKSVNI